MTGIYCKLDYKKYDPYTMEEVFKNGTVLVHKGQVKEWINSNELYLALL